MLPVVVYKTTEFQERKGKQIRTEIYPKDLNDLPVGQSLVLKWKPKTSSIHYFFLIFFWFTTEPWNKSQAQFIPCSVFLPLLPHVKEMISQHFFSFNSLLNSFLFLLCHTFQLLQEKRHIKPWELAKWFIHVLQTECHHLTFFTSILALVQLFLEMYFYFYLESFNTKTWFTPYSQRRMHLRVSADGVLEKQNEHLRAQRWKLEWLVNEEFCVLPASIYLIL